MGDFEDYQVLSSYSRDQAIKDGVLVEVLRWNGMPVVATSHIYNNLGLEELLTIWHEFLAWQDTEGRKPYKENKIFSTVRNNETVWVIEDIDGFTVLYPSDY